MSKPACKSERKSAPKTLYEQIVHAFASLDGSVELSKQFQAYSQQTCGKVGILGANLPAARRKRANRRTLQKWRSMHDALDKALANVVARIDPFVLQSFDNEHIVLVFYSVVANYAIDESGRSSSSSSGGGGKSKSGTTENTKSFWPKLDGEDSITARAYEISRAVEAKLVNDCKQCKDPAELPLRNTEQPSLSSRRKHVPLSAASRDKSQRASRLHWQTDSAACTSNGYFSDGCRVRPAASTST